MSKGCKHDWFQWERYSIADGKVVVDMRCVRCDKVISIDEYIRKVANNG